MNIKRWTEEWNVDGWHIEVTASGQRCGTMFWDVTLSPKCGWIWREGTYATKKDAMAVAKTIRCAPDKIAKIYDDAKKIRDGEVALVFGPNVETIHFAENVMCGDETGAKDE